MKKSVSIKDIAKLTNASITTVSFALNGKGNISEATRKRVLTIANENGYHANRMAVGLRTGVSKIIGLVVENIGGEFFGGLAKVIEEEAEKLGYRIIYCSTNNNIKKGKEVIKMLSHQLVDGYIITPLGGLEAEVLNLQANEKPLVLIDGYFPGLDIPHVLVDNFNSVKDAVTCFVNAGYKNIGYVTIDLNLVQLKDRLDGYQQTLKQLNISFRKKNVLKLKSNFTKKEALKTISDFIIKNKGLDAVLFSTNYLGTLGLQSLKDINKKIPEDIAVISFDDSDLFNLYPPGITTIQQPTYEIAKSAFDILISQIQQKKSYSSSLKLQIPSNLILRGSTKSKFQ